LGVKLGYSASGEWVSPQLVPFMAHVNLVPAALFAYGRRATGLTVVGYTAGMVCRVPLFGRKQYRR